jgi:hypothetical protein
VGIVKRNPRPEAPSRLLAAVILLLIIAALGIRRLRRG